jgi:hypothetical protein
VLQRFVGLLLTVACGPAGRWSGTCDLYFSDATETADAVLQIGGAGESATARLTLVIDKGDGSTSEYAGAITDAGELQMQSSGAEDGPSTLTGLVSEDGHTASVTIETTPSDAPSITKVCPFSRQADTRGATPSTTVDLANGAASARHWPRTKRQRP